MQPPAEHVHWLFGTGFVILSLCLLAEAIVGVDVWRKRAWRAYLWPGTLFFMGVMLWPVMTFFTNSTIHMLAHGAWADVLMFAGATELALVRGKLVSPWWRLATVPAFAHAALEHAGPSIRQRVQIAPTRLWLRFDQRVKPLPNSIVVYTASGTIVSGPARNERDPRYVQVSLRKIPRGAYTVRWHVI